MRTLNFVIRHSLFVIALLLAATLPLSAQTVDNTGQTIIGGTYQDPHFSGTAGPVYFPNGVASGTIQVMSGTVPTLIYVSSGTLVSQTGTNTAIPFITGTSIAYADSSGIANQLAWPVDVEAGDDLLYTNSSESYLIFAVDDNGNPYLNAPVSDTSIGFDSGGVPIINGGATITGNLDVNEALYMGGGDSVQIADSSGQIYSPPGQVAIDTSGDIITQGSIEFQGYQIWNSWALYDENNNEMLDPDGRYYWPGTGNNAFDTGGYFYNSTGGVVLSPSGDLWLNNDFVSGTPVPAGTMIIMDPEGMPHHVICAD